MRDQRLHEVDGLKDFVTLGLEKVKDFDKITLFTETKTFTEVSMFYNRQGKNDLKHVSF